jgi:hypothetical protein
VEQISFARNSGKYRAFPKSRLHVFPYGRLTLSFIYRKALGIENAVPDLLQGLAESRRLRDLRGVEYRVAVFGRRSSAHPGTRYLARGLNEFAAPGNEVEMEQLVWRRDSARSAETCDTCEGDEHSSSTPDTMTPSTSGTSASDVTSGAKKTTVPQKKPLTPSTDTVRWSSYVWRRGSVPIRWRQEIKQSIGDAEIFVASDAPYAGTGSYFSRLAFDYRPLDATPNDGFPVTCVNLLRCAPGKPEVLLSGTALGLARIQTTCDALYGVQ